MSNTLFVEQGSKLKIVNSNINVEIGDENYIMPFCELELIVIENMMCSITAGVIVECSRNNIPIIFCDEKHSPAASTSSMYSYYRQTKRIQEQTLWTQSRKEKLFILITKQKVLNQLELSDYLFDENNTQTNNEIVSRINKSNYLNVEAEVAREHFKKLFGRDFKRYERNDTNYMLNYGYALLRSKIRQIIVSKGLHPSLGIMHSNQFNNYNLSDDIIEVYRCIVDHYTYIIINSDCTNKEGKELLQGILHQNVIYDGKRTSVIRSIELFVDEIINYMNRESNIIKMPKLEGKLYELQI